MTQTEVEPPLIYSATRWPSNAELIRDAAQLGYLRKEWLTLDATYEKGVWWKKWKPDRLIVNDWEGHSPDLRFDFRYAPFADNTFDVVTYDPPYTAKGGRATSTIKEMDRAYGLVKASKTPQLLQAYINEGLTEMNRISGGLVLVKVKDYVSSGKLHLGVYHTISHALSLDMKIIDVLEHTNKKGGPQPKYNIDGSRRRQVHSRRNLSTLLILKASR